jgi:hypothetical protein
MDAFETVFADGPKIELDHYLVYFSRAYLFRVSYIPAARILTIVGRL